MNFNELPIDIDSLIQPRIPRQRFSEAISILNDDDAHDMFSKTLGFTQVARSTLTFTFLIAATGRRGLPASEGVLFVTPQVMKWHARDWLKSHCGEFAFL